MLICIFAAQRLYLIIQCDKAGLRHFLARVSRRSAASRLGLAMKAASALWRDSEGSAIIEATLLTPLLFALVLGVFEFSWVFYQQQLIEMGVRDAARYMARIPITSTATPPDTNPCDQTDTNGTGALFTTNAGNIALYATTTSSGSTQRVSGWTGPVTITCTQNTYASGTYAETSIYAIQATTSFTDPTLGLFGYLGLPTPSIIFTHNERYIGPG
jgi:Flp pilus assembly protein TadG